MRIRVPLSLNLPNRSVIPAPQDQQLVLREEVHREVHPGRYTYGGIQGGYTPWYIPPRVYREAIHPGIYHPGYTGRHIARYTPGYTGRHIAQYTPGNREA